MTLYKLPKRVAEKVLPIQWGINSPFESNYRSLDDMMDYILDEIGDFWDEWEHDSTISDEEFEYLEDVDYMAVAFYYNPATRHLVELTEWED